MLFRHTRRYAWLFAVLSLSVTLAGCGTRVERIEPEEVTDLSGAWNDTDSRLVSEEMINDMLSRSWVNDFKRRTGKQPAVIVGTVRNLSHEHINTNTFVNDIQRTLINSGRVTFVASRTERAEVREERLDQDIHASAETRKAMGQEYGADYMLSGQINTIIDMEGRTQVRYYQVDLTLISLTDNRKTWVGQKKIKKEVVNSKLRF